jgi:hypothetical protein
MLAVEEFGGGEERWVFLLSYSSVISGVISSFIQVQSLCQVRSPVSSK